MRATLAAILLFATSSAHADPAADFATLVADYEAWTEERDVQARIRAGDLDAMREWRDISHETIEQRDADMAEFYDRLQAIDADALEGGDTASYAVLEHILRHAYALPDTQGMYFPFTNDSGFHTAADFDAMSVRIRSAEEAQAWIDRLEGYPAHLDAWMSWLDGAIEAGWTQPREIIPGVIDQIAAQIVDDPRDSALYMPLANLPASIPAEERGALQERGAAVIADTVIPSIENLRAYFENTYLPASRDSIGISEIPGGREYYQALVRYHTSLDLTAEEVHQTGLDEVARIRAEMEEVIARTGFEGSF